MFWIRITVSLCFLTSYREICSPIGKIWKHLEVGKFAAFTSHYRPYSLYYTEKLKYFPDDKIFQKFLGYLGFYGFHAIFLSFGEFQGFLGFFSIPEILGLLGYSKGKITYLNAIRNWDFPKFLFDFRCTFCVLLGFSFRFLHFLWDS